ncbi:TlpA family protein disulfide reductase [Nocardioides alcanivorans]|uniref:TlpA family protein disulfide reductase n=1 Tax=Nocardioides alcanivorans TaxID=2897352 RepID=UPI001F34324A|nr:thioredoxin family protein [Nocardioides alcanivorans]
MAPSGTEVQEVEAPALAEYAVGERATLVQFSSAFCAPCRATRRTLAEVSDVVPGVAHVEIDAESQLELVRRLNILRTPTTIVIDAAGAEVSRASGAPTKPQVLQALGHALPDQRGRWSRRVSRRRREGGTRRWRPRAAGPRRGRGRPGSR